MPNKNHKCQCDHASVQFCKCCNTVWCKDCNQEWGAKSSTYWNYGYLGSPSYGGGLGTISTSTGTLEGAGGTSTSTVDALKSLYAQCNHSETK